MTGSSFPPYGWEFSKSRAGAVCLVHYVLSFGRMSGRRRGRSERSIHTTAAASLTDVTRRLSPPRGAFLRWPTDVRMRDARPVKPFTIA